MSLDSFPDSGISSDLMPAGTGATSFSVCLTGAGGTFRMSGIAWRNALRLAREYGWDTGETEPRPGDRVSAAAARKLADIFDRASADLPLHGAPPAKQPALLAFYTDGRPWLRNLAAFCRAGAFYIA